MGLDVIIKEKESCMDDIKEDLKKLCESSIELFNAGDYDGVANL